MRAKSLAGVALMAFSCCLPEGRGGAGRSECPPEAPSCDGLEQPCVIDEADPTEWPAASPKGLTEPLTNAGKYRVWPDGRVPYEVADSVGGTTKARLLKAMKEWQTKTDQRVRFEEAKAGEDAYVLVKAGSPQVDFVGYKKATKSTLYLGNPEYITVIRHELGHVLGLHHEHRRSDRGPFIQYKPENIVDTPKCKGQFEVCKDCVLVESYDIESVMHYRTYRDLKSCRKDDKPVLLAKDGSPIDHEWVISKGDLLAIEELYGPAPVGGGGGAGGGSGLGGAAGVGGAAGTGGAADAGGLPATGAAGGTAGNGGTGGADEGLPEDDVGAGGQDGTAGSGSGGPGAAVPGGAASGCGCRAVPSRGSESGWLLALALSMLRLRFRRSSPLSLREPPSSKNRG